jgi:outer membrane protein assembly factor BamB
LSRRLLPVLVLSLTLGGCAWMTNYLGGKDNREPPAELVAFDPVRSVHTLWSTRVGSGADRQYLKLVPAVADGRVYAADGKGRVVAVDAETGKTVWRTSTDAPIAGGPGVGEGLVLVGTSGGELLALDAHDGALAWRVPVSSEVLSVPRVADGRVVVHTGDGRVFALNAADGKRRWVFDRTVPVLTLRGTSSPVLTQGLAVGGFASGRLASLDARDGRLLWETAIAMPQGRSELERMVDISADPVVVGNVVYVVSFQGRLAALDLGTGRTLWSRDISSYAGLAADRRQVYVTDEQSHVWAFDARSGGSLWKQDKLHARGLTAPVLQGDAVVVGDSEGYLHWLSREDGSFLARERVDGSGILVPPAVEDDTLYAYGRKGALAAYRLER